MKQEELNKILEDGKGQIIDLKGKDLSGLNLSGAELSFADLSDANLKGADLWDVDLRFVYLRDAIYNNKTIFPTEFNPKHYYMIEEE